MTNTIPKWIKLNNEIMIQKDGKFQFEKDKEAVHSYFVDYINQNTVFFHDLKEKLDYLIKNDYYEEEFLSEYTFEQIKSIFKIAYSYKFRFPSFMSAFKFYNDYALKTNDKTKILERYEDRVSIVALYCADGDYEKAIEEVHAMMRQEYQPATPTFLNAGRKRRGEMVSCFLLEVGDSLNDISRAIDTSMQLSKLGGGVALNLNKLRAKGEAIKDVENATKGVVGVMKLLDNAFRYADQMGQRQGSGAAYLSVFHPDITDFLDTKKISADEDVRVKTLSIGVVLPDKFIELAREDKDFYMFYPHSVYKEYGQYLDEMDINKMYDELVENPRVRKAKGNARKLLEQLAILRSESGYPYIMFSDNVNKVHPNEHISKVKFSNLCSEVLQASQVSVYTDYDQEDEIGLDISCNLGSMNIVNVMSNQSIASTVRIAIDSLTTVTRKTNIVNAPAVARANTLMRSIGLGQMNLHGFLAQNKIAYESEEAKDFANTYFMMVNFYSLQRSMEIAKETGETYYKFDGSTYKSGEYFEKYVTNDYSPKYEKVKILFGDQHIPNIEDWMKLKEDVMKYGLYHSYRQAVAPTGSISYVQSSTAGVMPIMERIEERTYGNSKTYYPMPGLSAQNWFFFKEAYDMDMFKVVDLIATIQQHVDQGISFTLFLKDTMTTRDLNRIDLYAHHKGIKTLYYARTKDTTQEGCLSCVV
ncbi:MULTISPECIES: class 1b ribonucleoside-diphosphate reductase subunit alpha [Bacillus amyloliquefaciens group]|uniref:class 1b ribonucleoside-diphosphate reductase subunit alpha n=1 Tax=Bacillus amyloliquefaciens group TaxID=1938374 RepID=UPI00025315C0|nr:MULTISPECIES: class 1b ribonucleoside-diphosphate reductase subunit alpha [Bacillus amyloliquefaciens group]AUG36013.1 class 1b ribonucleoside-diphosphate reductase subunit alpha [Bacillus velezensis]QRL09160.1 class 1b ribonucleoside-diphosphate reductase subunit alpha [Bacillus velezensis]QTG83421.1 class 1b ribonucleoside-diphosphate reductase subunit alpha [Bacillus amyloliquefaciens]UYV24741.1 class 1b ribonucleoside-diphosphate reductase subunit alpha [Bacillus velezensis]WDW02108.1 c